MANSKRKSESINLSASTISDYISCPRKVYYRLYRPDIKVETDALIIGNLVHNTLEKYSDDFMSAMEYISSSKVSNDIKSKAADMVAKYFRYFTDIVDSDDNIEEFIRFSINKYPFIAKIDRYNDRRIIDWKTSKKSKGNGVESDIQSIIYAEAFKSKFGNYPEQILFVNLRNVDVSHAKVKSRFKDYFLSEIVPYVYDGIKSNKFPALGRFNWYSPCKYCQYKDICTADITEVRNDKT